MSNFGNRGHGLFGREVTSRVVLLDQPLLARENYAANKKDKTNGQPHAYSLSQAALLSYSRPYATQEFTSAEIQ